MNVHVSEGRICHLHRPRQRTLGETLRLWLNRIQERRHLLELDDYLLKDLGLSRSQALTEADKPFWQA